MKILCVSLLILCAFILAFSGVSIAHGGQDLFGSLIFLMGVPVGVMALEVAGW